MIERICGAVPTSLAAAFIAGVAGSLHCVAMCGGISGALAMRARALQSAPARALAHTAAQQIGRIASYASIGAVCGAFGGAIQSAFDLGGAARVMRVATGVFLIAIASRVAFGWRGFDPVERLGAKLWRRLTPLVRPSPGRGFGGSLLLGAIWGFMPCGMIYSMLIFAALSGEASRGAATMLAFGLGTWPAMLGGGLISAQLWRVTAARGVRAAAGAVLFLFGLATALGSLAPWYH